MAFNHYFNSVVNFSRLASACYTFQAGFSFFLVVMESCGRIVLFIAGRVDAADKDSDKDDNLTEHRSDFALFTSLLFIIQQVYNLGIYERHAQIKPATWSASRCQGGKRSWGNVHMRQRRRQSRCRAHSIIDSGTCKVLKKSFHI